MLLIILIKPMDISVDELRIPVDTNDDHKIKKEDSMPIDGASCLSHVYYSWMTPIIWRSFQRKGLQPRDIYRCSPLDACHTNTTRMANLWHEECGKHGLSRLIFAAMAYLVCLLLGYLSSTLFLKNLLDYIETDSSSIGPGLKWTCLLFLCELTRCSSYAIMYGICIRTGIRTSSALTGLLYRKLLTAGGTSSATIGETVNLFAVDMSKVFNMVHVMPLVIGGPVVTLATVGYTWWLLGPLALVGDLAFVAIFAIQFATARGQAEYRRRAVANSDKRVALMAELLAHIRTVKLYGWEQVFAKRVIEYRRKEIRWLKMCQYLQCVSTSLAVTAPLIITVITILVYTSAGRGDLTSAKAFTLVMINYMAAHGIRSLPIYIRDIVNGRIALARIERVLKCPERADYITANTDSPTVAIHLNHVTVAWDEHKESGQLSTTTIPRCLTDINLDVPVGAHVGVIGAVGAGKTSLLRTILGQMALVSGRVGLRGSVAYVAQEPCILNTTIQDNITFGQPYDPNRYHQAIRCCALGPDFGALPAGDRTEIGERGVTLSGGQRQRVSRLVRTGPHRELYDTDLDYRQLIDSSDDIMAANVEEDVAKDQLKDTTNGTITQSVRHRRSDSGVVTDSDSGDEACDSYSKLMSGRLMSDERVATGGDISWDTYLAYVKAGGGPLVTLFLIAWLALQAGCNSFANWWLGYWLAQGSGNTTHTGVAHPNQSSVANSILNNPDLSTYQTVYGLSVIVVVMTTLALGYGFTKVTLGASKRLHNRVFRRVLDSPLAFYHTVPAGRVLNVFVRDMDEMDTQVPQALDGFCQRLMVVLCNVGVIVFVYPWFTAPFAALALAYGLIHRLFRGATRDLKRLESAARSPVYSHVTATIDGRSTIIAYGREREFANRLHALVDRQSAANFLYHCSVRWLSTRVDILCALVTLFAALFAVFGRHSVGAPFAGLALVLSIQYIRFYV
ncbi:unnamed protein product [Medioppia subpectinata]|uniref:Uncharacterized protein n=1 Tax=Medioppia subpectinata TaxID=1979941 RepID=A0A7R9KRN7_9ACAR|nr:unnamed protein product [Medioppia subpectinata]CAG2108569.1 unnamed protein product [Medioppia subpectinata]